LNKSNLAKEPVAVETMKQNKGAKSWQNESALCTRKRNNSYEATSLGIVVHPDRVLVKTSTDNSCWQAERCSDDRSSWSLYTSKVI